MTLSEELQWRGFVNQTTLKDISQLDKQNWTFYHGFDASADSQTVGNLAAMMFDKVFLRHGHKAIVLAGGATSLLGDPGGKDSERPLQDEKTIAYNVACAEAQLRKIYGDYTFKLVNNIEWFKTMNVLTFMRDIGKHFSMTPLVQRDYIAKRMGEGGAGISYTEFSYTLLQGYDFLHLHKKYNVNLQLAGSDQWGNSISGVDLIRRVTGDETHIMTLPLVINKATGKKFGKSEEGAVWLDEKKTSAFKFYQFWLNADDEGVEGYLKIFTELDKPTIDLVMAEFKENRSGRVAQKRLAYEVTRIVHGEAKAKSVKKATEFLFTKDEDIVLSNEVAEVLKGELAHTKLKDAPSLADALLNTWLAMSKSEANQLIKDGAVSVNGRKVTDPNATPFKNNDNLIKCGKNRFSIISW
ncbi:MAG TPA: tyrosine--tRNA ligase [Candidatus Saccharimonadales bacterium]|nr:tyrosine--tRNA ligase [Candidatus Saccharimonadales bacterium]